MATPQAGSPARDLAGWGCVVTGSSTGIGRAIAIALAARGAHVLVHGRTRSAELDATQAAIVAQGGRVSFVTADLSDTRELPILVDRAWELLGEVHVWINNAGCDVLTGAAADWSFSEKLERLWQVDVRATLLLSRLAGTRMQQEVRSRGHNAITPPGSRSLVLIGWDQAWQGMAGDSGIMFGSIKGAVMSLTGHLAQTFAPEIRVNCVAPGWIATEWGEQASDYWQHRARSESLMGRWGRPDDVAAAVSYLISPASGFISGQVLPVNGGFHFGAVDQRAAN